MHGEAAAPARDRATFRGILTPWTVLLLAILVVVLVLTARPPVPVIWGDTPPFVESALRTLEAGRLVVAGGRDPGYPAFLAVIFARGGDLVSVVRLQQAAWVVLVLVLATMTLAVTRRAVALVPLILVASYPGLLLFRNVPTAELLSVVFLNITMAGLLLATRGGRTARCWAAAVAVVAAAVALCLRSQALLIPVVAVIAGVALARPDTLARRAILAVSVAAALLLAAFGSRLAAQDADEASAVFVSKTLVCNHLNLVLGSDAARREIAASAGANADDVMARLQTDLATDPMRWPVLGLFGDACLYDTALDREIASDDAGAAAAWRRIVRAALREHPLAFAEKFVRQMAYGVLVAWPPYGLGRTIPESRDDVQHVADIMARHGRSFDLTRQKVPMGILTDYADSSAWMYRALSAVFVAAIAFWAVTVVRRSRSQFALRGGIVLALWAASIAPAAAAHTLDVWRYLIPVVPMVAMLLALVAVELLFWRERRAADKTPA